MCYAHVISCTCKYTVFVGLCLWRGEEGSGEGVRVVRTGTSYCDETGLGLPTSLTGGREGGRKEGREGGRGREGGEDVRSKGGRE